MTGPFLSPPIRSGYGSAALTAGGGDAACEARILRDRQAAYEDALDAAAQAAESRPFESARLLVQVYDGGSMPSSPGLWYFTHPVLVYGAETEGGGATMSVDTETTIPVIVLNGVPSVGDYLTAYSVGGRWVAEKNGCSITINVKCSGTNVEGDTVTLLYGMTTISSGTTNSSGNVTLAVPLPVTNPYTITITGGGNLNFSTSQSITCGGSYSYNVCESGVSCSPCAIPTEDLTITWTNPITGNGSATLTYTAPSTWTTGCCDDGLIFTLQCTEDEIELRATYFISGECPTGDSNYCSNLRTPNFQVTLVSSTCSPFSLTFDCTDDACPTLFGVGNTQFIITL